MRKRPGLSSLDVRLVEDHAACRDALATLLRLEGASVSATGTARGAVALARRHAFDVVITDLGLPDESGSMLIREIIATAKGRPHLAVLTGSGEVARAEARRAGAEVIFGKPLAWDAIVDYLRSPNTT